MAASFPPVSIIPGLPPDEVLFGCTDQMRNIRATIERAGEANVPVLIVGDTGTGKEVIAKSLHRRSLGDQPFVKVSCAAVPEMLLESELFGYAKGAFTGAEEAKRGRVEGAHGGTLFLDEIGDLAPHLQTKLLHFLQDRQFTPLGAIEDRSVDVRVICATSRSLEDDVANGSFRADLLYRINVIQVHLPALRARREDIPLLIDYFAEMYSARFHLPKPHFPSEHIQFLKHRPWPGNIRELENFVARYVVLGEAGEATGTLDELGHQSLSLKQITRQAARDLEQEVIFRVLRAQKWNRRRTAEVLNISYRALKYKLRQAGFTKRRSADRRAGTPGNGAADDFAA